MKKTHYVLMLICAFILMGQSTVFSQTSVSVGSGSYASYPPAEELQFEWEGEIFYDDYNFVYNNEIYVTEGETRPIPTNDWWTNILVEQYGGLLFAYPLVMQPLESGLQIQYPTGFSADGSNLDRGTGIVVKAAGFEPDKAIASDWSDWLVEMSMPDESTGVNMKVTMGHGIPFTWIETNGMNPEISAGAGAAYYTAEGTEVSFPLASGSSFVLSSEGRLFGIHMGDGVSAELSGQQYITIDLGASYSLSEIDLLWEAAFASAYSIQVSDDNSNWTTLQSVSNGDGGNDHFSISGSGRYVRILLLERGTIYAYSLFEVEVISEGVNVALNKDVMASSSQAGFVPEAIVDGNEGIRWASEANVQESLVFNMGNGSNHLVISALTQFSDLSTYDAFAHNKPTDTEVVYDYDVAGGKVNTTWNITTTNLDGSAAGDMIQGFIPHQYKNTTYSNVNFVGNNYVTARGTMKTAYGRSFSFSYPFGGILPSFTAPYSNDADTNPYSADVLYQFITDFSAAKTGYGADTYWGGKDLVNLAKYTLMAKELNHQSYESLKERTKAALIDWLTYTPGETSKYFARYERWKALIGFDQSYGSAQFTDNHFHYGYLIHAAGLYGMIDDDFLTDYGDMLKLVAQQYANWNRNDTFLPYFRTFDPWIGHSYAGGTSSGGGNNQESTSEAMQSWIGLYLLGDAMGDAQMRDAGAFGYRSEAAATLEYWFDWDEENLPEAYDHNMVGILWNGGYSFGTYFSASPVHIHGIQYLPVCPGFKYLAEDPVWAAREYTDMMDEAAVLDGHSDEIDFGDDWAHVALGFRMLFDPAYVADFMDTNMALGSEDSDYIMDYEVAGMSYFYTHAIQNLGDFSFKYHTNFPSSSVFEENGVFSRAVVFNASGTAETCYVYDANGTVQASFEVPAKTLYTYPELPTDGQEPESCYALSSVATASSGSSSVASAVDASMATRWVAESTDEEWVLLDLGMLCTISQISIDWEVASAADYIIEGSVDGAEWTSIQSYTGLSQGDRTDVVDNLTQDLQFVRVTMTEAATPWPYSIFEISVCGKVAEGTYTGLIEPSFIEAEDYVNMSGIQTEPTTDVNGGINVGWIDAGDYMEYEIEVYEAGTYKVDYRVASIPGGGNLQFQLNGITLSSTIVNATGGWQNWTTLSTNVILPAGTHVIRLYAESGGFNLNWLEIYKPGMKSGKISSPSENTMESEFKLYPNPAKDVVYIKTSADLEGQIQVFDMSGKMIYTSEMESGSQSHQINLQGWAKGVYNARVISGQLIVLKRFVVK